MFVYSGLGQLADLAGAYLLVVPVLSVRHVFFFLYVFVVVVVDVIPSSFSLPPEAWPGLDRLAAKPVTLLPPCHYMEHFTPALWKRVYAASPSLRDYAEEERRVKLARRGRAGTAGSASGDFLQSKSEGPVTPCRARVVRSVGLVSLKKKKKSAPISPLVTSSNC